MITKAKILCTLGPASSKPEQIQRMVDLGMDSVRINFSHGTIGEKIELFQNIRKIDPSLAILCDIQGPKIRIGEIQGSGVQLKRDSEVVITTEEIEGDEKRFSISYKKLSSEVQPGDLIFINDGIVSLQVKSITGTEITCHTLAGGWISSRKGVNLPSTEISLRVPTEKDLKDLKDIAKLDPEYVAVSFIGSADDITLIRKKLKEYGNDRIKLIAKIERPVAVQNFDSILKVADGIMVARGDLGVEIPAEEVPPLQKEMIRKCNIVGKPVIVATQMLESMVKNPTATRAEISDVYNAIMDGADAVMLSAETASGDYPFEAVSIMKKVMSKAEGHFPGRNPNKFDSKERTYSEIIGHMAYSVCLDFPQMGMHKGKVLCLTQSGYTARMISKYHPSLPILAITQDSRTARELRLQWGIQSVYIPQLPAAEKQRLRVMHAISECYDLGIVEKDETMIVVGNFLTVNSLTNMLSIHSVQDVVDLF